MASRRKKFFIILILTLFLSGTGGGAYFFIKDPFQKRDEAIIAIAKALGYVFPRHVAEFSARQGVEFLEKKELDKATRMHEVGILTGQAGDSLLNNYAFILADSGDWASAAEYWEKSVTKNSECAECTNNLGVAYYRLGRWEKTRELFKKASMLNTQYLDANLNLAVWSEEHSDWPMAIKFYERAAKLTKDKDILKTIDSRLSWMREVVQPVNKRDIATKGDRP